MQRPGIGCGAFIEEDGRVLLVLRLREPEKNVWNLPGGKVDWGEGTRAAVAREVREEIGVDIEVGALLCLAELIGPGHHWVSPVYRATIRSGRPANCEPAKHGDVRWWPLDALPPACGLAVREAVSAACRG